MGLLVFRSVLKAIADPRHQTRSRHRICCYSRIDYIITATVFYTRFRERRSSATSNEIRRLGISAPMLWNCFPYPLKHPSANRGHLRKELKTLCLESLETPTHLAASENYWRVNMEIGNFKRFSRHPLQRYPKLRKRINKNRAVEQLCFVHAHWQHRPFLFSSEI